MVDTDVAAIVSHAQKVLGPTTNYKTFSGYHDSLALCMIDSVFHFGRTIRP